MSIFPRIRRRHLLIAAGVIGAIGLGVLGWEVARPGALDFAGGTAVQLAAYQGRPTGVPADLADAGDPLVRGKYLVQAADCEACHTVPGGAPYAGGRAFVTDFGTLYSPNITPDKETGIGDWTDADFLKAMHEGVGKDGQPYYPAFPYAAYTYVTDEDALAMKAYLFSLPAVRKTAPDNAMPFPFNQRWLMWFWRALYNPAERFKPRPERSESWNRGAYLTEALAHCGDCHTPRTAFQALDHRDKFGGGPIKGWNAYNISTDKQAGIGAWSDDELTRYLATGRTHRNGSAFGPMAEAINLGSAHLTPADMRAMIEYLRSVPATGGSHPDPVKSDPAPADPAKGVALDSNRKGLAIYAAACAGCHGWTGDDALGPNTRLTGLRAVNDASGANVALAIVYGTAPLPRTPAYGSMPAFGHVYTDSEIAAVANYVTARFGNKASDLTAEDVRRLRAQQ